MKSQLLALLVLLHTAAAQEAPSRVAHPGRVLAADGAAVAGAEVTLVSVEREISPAGPDVVRATADANGRFRAQVLPTCLYRLWAVRPRGAQFEVSPVVEQRLPASEVRFAADGGEAPAHLQILGGEKWKDQGPLRVQVLVGGAAGFVAEQELGTNGSVPVPPLGLCEIEVFVTAKGSLVHYENAGGSLVVALPPPQRVRAEVVDGDGKPMPGVRIDRIVSGWRRDVGPFGLATSCARRPVATSDAEGRAEWWVAYNGDPYEGVGYPPIAFLAAAADHREGIAGFSKTSFANSVLRPTAAGAEPGLRFELVKHEAPALAVTGVPAAGLRVNFSGWHMVPMEENGATSLADEIRWQPGVGAPDPAPTFRGQLAQIHGLMPALAADDPFRRSCSPHPLLVAWDPSAQKQLDLSGLEALRLQWIDSSGGPAMGVQVQCLPLDAGDLTVGAAIPAMADAGGRLVLPVVPGRWYVLAVRGGDWLGQELTVTAGMAPQTLRLEKLMAMRVRVVDGDGKPIAGARFQNTGASWQGGGDAIESCLQQLANQVASWSLVEASTDAAGLATIPFLKRPRQRIDFQAYAGERRSAELHLVADDEVVDVVLK